MFSELPINRCPIYVMIEKPRHIELKSDFQRGFVITLSICVIESSVPVPSGMMWFYLCRPLRTCASVIPVASERYKNSHESVCRAVHRIQSDRAFCGIAKAIELFSKEQRLRKSLVRKRICW